MRLLLDTHVFLWASSEPVRLTEAMRAALAIAHKILVAAYHMIAKAVPYRELGDAYLDQIGQIRTVANLKRRLERLGYRVSLEPNAAVA